MQPVTLMRLTKVSNPNDITADLTADKLVVEPKWDGYLVQVIFAGGPRVYSRRGKNITPNFPDIADKLVGLGIPEKSVLIGELIWIDEGGKQSITTINSIAGSSAAKARRKREGQKGHSAIIFYDILLLKGKDVTKESFSKRRKLLEDLLKGKTSRKIMLSPVQPFDSWEQVSNKALELGGEGVVIKNKDSPYVYSPFGEREPKPRNTWWKWKPPEKAMADDFVVYNISRTDKGKLMVEYGQYHEGQLFRVGQIDSFSEEVEKEMEELISSGPFVIEMGFEERTADGKLRHPHFLRIRDDKNPMDADLPPEFAQTLKPAPGAKFEARISKLLAL